MKPIYITTPIYYPSGRMHLGHAYTTIAGDVLKKYHQQNGSEVFYLTGSDEHGEKIEQKAQEEGITPKEYVDGIVDTMKTLWELLEIDYDKFIRTTDEEHMDQVKYIFNRLLENDDIYLGEYSGLYCTSCESYYTETQAEENKCPDCGKELRELKEECYFFRCSKYVDRLVEHLEANEEFLKPVSRKNELINNFIKPGLQDLAVSRTNFKWGIEVPSNPEHVIYVWIDALTNYITALGYKENSEEFQKFWPADVQLLGKEITRFHVIYWPMILMALDIELPKKLFAHGWLLMDRDKMSKSKGNIIYPEFLVENYGVDTIRYYLMREVPFGTDGMFTPETYINRINNDLANDIGNLVNRTVAMCNKYFDGEIKKPKFVNIHTKELVSSRESLDSLYHETFNELLFSKNLGHIWDNVSITNKLIDLTEPWVLFKEGNFETLNEVMYTLLSQIEYLAVRMAPYMRNTATEILKIIGANEQEFLFDRQYNDVYKVEESPKILFVRLETEDEITKIQNVMDEQKKQAQSNLKEEYIEFDDFKKVKQIVVQVTSAEKHSDAKKLLVLKVDAGEYGSRQVVSGIAEFYQPEDLVGKKLILVSNLEPRKLRGEISEGMILTTGEKDIKLIMLSDEHENGSLLK